MKLSVIIVSWNSQEFLVPCLTSVFNKNPDFDFEVILIDNASTDHSIGSVKEVFTQVKTIENKENIGFTRANNQGIGVSKGEYILLLNPDTIIIEENLFKKWVTFMDEHPEAGASGCRLIYPDGVHQVGDAGYKPSLKTVINFSFFISRIFSQFRGLFVNYKKLTHPVEVDWICGADFLVRRSILDKVGLMNEDIFMYADDIEWGCRIRDYGYKIFYLPHFSIIHLQGGSAKKREDIGSFSNLWLKNIRLFFKYCNKNQPVFLYDVVISTGFLLRAFFYYCLYITSKKEDTKIKAKKMFTYFKFSISNMMD
ncbi:MAG TPA: glycosyltransferase family 2 protein [Syntrophorhabdaceae bacterium]|nr:glycosyltransferase family 2 protein [Syntrophorhabdaceae bacterium]HOL04752.1 glycosyltransferase family 2 protein [Syntrophorhabdaceae bacterium]HQK47479.1 glycosyltransferase family 2 protein [Syntrophorhabdaceae bacterium]